MLIVIYAHSMEHSIVWHRASWPIAKTSQLILRNGMNQFLTGATLRKIYTYICRHWPFVKHWTFWFMDTPDMRAWSGHSQAIKPLSCPTLDAGNLEYRWTINRRSICWWHTTGWCCCLPTTCFLAWLGPKIKSETRDWTTSQPQLLPHLTDRQRLSGSRRVDILREWPKGEVMGACEWTAKPYAKGEGPSQMVTDMASADYVVACAHLMDQKLARVLFKAGKNREGYFTMRTYWTKQTMPWYNCKTFSERESRSMCFG